MHTDSEQGWAFPPAFNTYSGAVDMSKECDDIRESLTILLSTTPGERVMEPEYGCDLSPLAFRRLDLNLQTFMINNIKRAIEEYETRVQVTAVTVADKRHSQGIVDIKVAYTIKSTGATENLSHPYSFNASGSD